MINKRHALVMIHRGIGIYTLKVADPNKGELGYVVDCKELEAEKYSTIAAAWDAINKIFSEVQE